MIEEDIIKWVAEELRIELFKNINLYPCLYSTFKNMVEHEGLLMLYCVTRGHSFNSEGLVSVSLAVVNGTIRIIYGGLWPEDCTKNLELADPNIITNILINVEKNLRGLNGSLSHK